MDLLAGMQVDMVGVHILLFAFPSCSGRGHWQRQGLERREVGALRKKRCQIISPGTWGGYHDKEVWSAWMFSVTTEDLLSWISNETNQHVG
jgi:hypothetical protein